MRSPTFRATTIGLLLCLSTPLLSQDQPGSAKPSTPVASIDACVNEFTASKVESTKAGYQYWFVDRNMLDGRTIKLSVVAPGYATHAPHTHVEDEFFFVLAGRAEFLLNGERRTVGPMTSLYCPPRSNHGIRNAGPDTLHYLVIKKYERP